MVLLAPDGLKTDPYYHFFTGTTVGKKVFRHMLEQPRSYMRMINLMKATRMVHPSRHKFAMHFLQTEDARKLLLAVWPTMRGVKPNRPQLTAAIKKYGMPITIFMGINDRIMPPAMARRFMTGMETITLHVLEKGHRLLDVDTAAQIAAPLLRNK